MEPTQGHLFKVVKVAREPTEGEKGQGAPED